ncbi:NADP-dependent phosphogluconate dehydrogenase [Microbacterium sp. zg.Y1090]|uniref:NADP-dependent phosphogluconate dehydrogenase n=1 Tax=Microbacterium TaxID=33882 RepID=UPI00214B98ED|nr:MULTISPECIES: NADP-dependent phosphogluconate dehydrogenase [unclassified Microbacterium]MCR2812201.1 NADP-dependent phosphogluconate dehydrogenase [Microbacterium sp. zg.Y1084]MCR2818361.1 NADP-dependent phosphogluconate dehydrogenase [Microbacterium sp. zg.Y1090]MDL5486173.1 NADP-dependent phosphogluconate dehydrogenase [Microbacterium sp. zg-Y1211]WIM29380.1 NADP-dependent phosphogluconate dehydrogenase [Microbacterium sp. zg-Y1090]
MNDKAQTTTSDDRDDTPGSAEVHEGAPSPQDVPRPAATPEGPDSAAAPRANIGVVGLAVMGSNLARNLASREGNTVAVYNRSRSKTDELVAEHPEAGFVPTFSYDEFAASLQRPRTAIIMVKAGGPTDAVIDALTKVFEPGDIIVDGGNALFTDTIRREKAVRETGINFVGAGISGGEEGALTGPSIMPGGSDESWVTLGPILRSIAAVAEGEPCVTHVGHDGAGHFVKMVHNGIEYADMQLIAEAYDLIRRGTGKSPAEIADVFAEWNRGELESYLIEITAEVLRQVDAETGRPLVDVILDQAGAKGTGAWTVQTALNLGTPVSGIAEAVFARSLSSHPEQRQVSRELPGASETLTVDDPDAFIENVRLALYASKIVAYSQGFDEIRAGAAEYDWAIDLGAIAKIWRGGCIIRAQFLNRISDAYAAAPDLPVLLTAPYFVEALGRAQDAWRGIVATAATAGIPAPAFSSSLAYYDGLRAERLPAALIQGQRDFFGAHTYKRIDKPGTFHTLWSGDRTEIEAEDTH